MTVETSKVDKRGRITLPKEVRDSSGITPGTTLAVVEKSEDKIVLRKLTLDDLIEEAERDLDEGNTIPHEEIEEKYL